MTKTLSRGLLSVALVLAAACADPSGDPALNDTIGGDAIGGTCAGAPCAGSCCSDVCTDVAADANNCGACGAVCSADQVCLSGRCTRACEGGGYFCGGACVDVQSTFEHCGACASPCATGQVCSGGTCRTGCDLGLAACNGSCISTLTSAAHCGGCGQACGTNQLCDGGTCACALGYEDCDGDLLNGCEAAGGCVCSPGESRPCFAGAASAAGVGACVRGSQACAADGTGWSTCAGSVLPQKELCGNGKDDDCDGQTDEDADEDADGYSTCGGDCCDSLKEGCAADPSKVNPGAYDFDGNHIDDDCDGTVDNPPATTCSASQVVNGVTGDALVQAMDLCQFVGGDPNRWGVLEASLHRANGQSAPDSEQLAVLRQLGGRIPSDAGSTMASLSSGTARGTGDSGYVDPSDPCYETASSVTAPARYVNAHGGMLQTVSGCPAGDNSVNDSAMLRVKIRVPTNAEGFSFRHRFFSSEYPVYLCTEYNDFFLALLDSQHTDLPADGNISFDTNGDPVSVNNAFFTTCSAQPCYYDFWDEDDDWDGCPDSLSCNGSQCISAFGACPDGSGDVLAYTASREASGATSWLTTQAPVVPGEVITLEFHIWDTSDSLLDSLVLLDNFQWRLEPTEVVTYN